MISEYALTMLSKRKELRACMLLVTQSTRSYLYVEDVAEAFDVVLRKGKIGETYNIGTQKERTVMDVAQDIAAIFSIPTDRIMHVRDRAFNDQRYAPSSCQLLRYLR